MGLSDETRADIGGLFDYYNATLDSFKGIGDGWMPAFSIASGVIVGTSNVTDAVRFQQKLSGVIEAFGMFLSDSGKGLHYLADGALCVADNYAKADMDMAAEMSSIADAFTPAPDRSDVADANSSEFASQREAYFHPTNEAETLPTPAPSSFGKCYDVPPTPDEEAGWHSRKFEGYETWRPNEPEPETDFSDHVSVN